MNLLTLTPSYLTNVFKVDISGELFVAIFPSKELSRSISLTVKFLRESLKSEGLINRCFVTAKDKHLVILSPQEDILKNIISRLYEVHALKKYHEARVYDLATIPNIYKPIVYNALATSLQHYILQVLYKGNWIILSSGKGTYRVYTKEDTNLSIELPHPLADYVSLYRGMQIATLPLTLYDVFGNSSQSIGLCIDPVVIIEPTKTIEELIEENITYNEKRVQYKESKDDELFNYKVLKYEIWDVINIDYHNKRIKVFKLMRDKREGSWKPKIEELRLNEVYPLRRPEVLDRIIRSKHRDAKPLTVIVRKESFHIIAQGKRDEQAPQKRFAVTMLYIEKISKIISNAVNKYLDALKVYIDISPLRITR